jgi:hypothetical protein
MLRGRLADAWFGAGLQVQGLGQACGCMVWGRVEGVGFGARPPPAEGPRGVLGEGTLSHERGTPAGVGAGPPPGRHGVQYVRR